jgi:hypothetical protein
LKTVVHNQGGRPGQQAVALIMVMLVVVALAVIAGGFAYSVRVETTLARNAGDDQEFEWLAQSGVEFARYVLSQQFAIQEQPYDAMNQFWAGRRFVTNDVFEGLSLTDVPLGRGSFSVAITDLDRKFNINMANEEVLMRAADMIGIDLGDAGVIAHSIMDWIDPDSDPHLNGVETDYYQSLDPPYICKDGPLDELSELLFVNGITEDMFFGSPPELLNPAGMTRLERFRLRQMHLPVYTNSFVNLFTTLGTGRVNINTVSSDVLQLLGFDELQAQEIVTYRAGYDGQEGTEDDTPFTSPGELAGALGIPGGGGGTGGGVGMQSVLGVRSVAFEVTVTCMIGDRSRQRVARIARRNADDVRVLYSYWTQ